MMGSIYYAGGVPGASWFPMLDALYDHKFCEAMRTWRDEGLTLDQIGDRILTEHGFRPSTSALQRYSVGECDS
jgi:hypothetical protein